MSNIFYKNIYKSGREENKNRIQYLIIETFLSALKAFMLNKFLLKKKFLNANVKARLFPDNTY